MNNTHETMQRIFDATGENPANIAHATKNSPQTVNNWVKRGISKKGAIGIAKVYGLSVDWILTGIGDVKGYEIADEPKKVKVHRIDVKASCGEGYLNLDNPKIIETYEFTESYLRSRGLNTNGEGLVIIDADGKSMEPTIPDKTPLLINRFESSFNELSTGKVYVFLVNGSIICKRIFINLDGSLTLRSDNPDKTTYPDQIVSKDKFSEFNVIGRLKTALVEF